MAVNCCTNCVQARIRRHSHCMQALHASGNLRDCCNSCRKAAKYGHLDCIQSRLFSFSYRDPRTCFTAAKFGNLACLQYAHEEGFPWDMDVCAVASQYGNLECLKYAHENGCPWNICTTYRSPWFSNLGCRLYALRNGCPRRAGYGGIVVFSSAHQWLRVLSVVRVCIKLRHMEQRRCAHHRKQVMLDELLALPCKLFFRGGKIFTHFPGGTDARKATKRFPDDDYTDERDPKRIKPE